MSPSMTSLKPIKIIFPKGDCSSLRYNPYNKSYVRSNKKQKRKVSNVQANFLRYSSSQHMDDEWVSDNLSTPPNPKHTRFWLQNCQGVITTRDINQYHFETQKYLDKNIQYLAFTETRINPSRSQTTFELEHGYTHLVSHGRIDITNTPGFPSTSSYQPGGVAAAFHGRISNRYTKAIRDPGGRWITHEFAGKSKSMRVYTLYRVNPQNAKADTSSWSQQKRYLQQLYIDDDPRSRVIDDLLRT